MCVMYLWRVEALGRGEFVFGEVNFFQIFQSTECSWVNRWQFRSSEKYYLSQGTRKISRNCILGAFVNTRDWSLLVYTPLITIITYFVIWPSWQLVRKSLINWHSCRFVNKPGTNSDHVSVLILPEYQMDHIYTRGFSSHSDKTSMRLFKVVF